MKRRPLLTLALALLLSVSAALGAAQWRARDRFLTQGWTEDFPEPVADTPGAMGKTMSRACVNAPLESYAQTELEWALDAIEAGGYAWVRQRISWVGVAAEPGVLDWSRLDALFESLSGRSLELIAVLDDAPAWAGAPGGPPDSIAYAEWAGAVAERYGDRITYYQIWHNPNLGDNWGGRANAFEYADLLARAAGAIRAADAEARIVLGALAPTAERGQRNYAEDLFLEMLYEAGAAPNFDIVSVQPYGFNTGPDDRRVSPDVLNFSRPILVRQVVVGRGESHKAIWAGNFGWNSKPSDWTGSPSIWGTVDEIAQASYTVAALERVEREWPWMGVLCLNSFQPRPEAATAEVPDAAASRVPDVAASRVPDAEEHWGFALMTPEGEPRPAYKAVQTWTAETLVAHAGVYRADTDLATFDGYWKLGPQGADIGEHGENTVSFTFEGTGVALTVRRGPYRAFLFVTVDGEPAQALPRDRDGRAYAVLFDPLAEVATVTLAEGLASGVHTVEIEAERGWGQWALADWRVVDAPRSAVTRRLGYLLFSVLGLLGVAGVAWSLPRIELKTLARRAQGAWNRLDEWLRMLVSFVAAAITLFSAWQMLMGEAVFRRLGEHGDLIALALATGLFYVSPWLILTLIAGLLMSLIVVLHPSLGLALVIFAAPLYAYPLSLSGRAFALAELVLLPTLVGWGLRWMGTAIRERRRLRDTFTETARGRRARAMLWPLLTLVAISIVSSFGAQHLREALRELRLVVIEPTLFFVALVTLPMTRREFRRERWRMLDALVAGALMVALVGLVMYFQGNVITAEGGSRRLLSVYGSPNNVGLFLGRVLPVLVAVVLWAGPDVEVGLGWGTRARAWLVQLLQDRRRRAYLLAIVPVVLALGLSLSRGAILLGVPVALVTMGWLAGKRWRRATLVVLLVGLTALIPLLRTPRFAGMFDISQGTTGFRLSLWYSSLGMIRDHPWLGVGLDNFLYAYRTRYVLPTAWEEFSLSHPHNVLLDYAVRLGLPALCAFVWTQVVFWRRVLPPRSPRARSRRATPADRALAIGLAGSMAGFLAHGLVDASYFIIDLAFVYMLSLALACWLDERAFDN